MFVGEWIMEEREEGRGRKNVFDHKSRWQHCNLDLRHETYHKIMAEPINLLYLIHAGASKDKSATQGFFRRDKRVELITLMSKVAWRAKWLMVSISKKRLFLVSARILDENKLIPQEKKYYV